MTDEKYLVIPEYLLDRAVRTKDEADRLADTQCLNDRLSQVVLRIYDKGDEIVAQQEKRVSRPKRVPLSWDD